MVGIHSIFICETILLYLFWRINDISSFLLLNKMGNKFHSFLHTLVLMTSLIFLTCMERNRFIHFLYFVWINLLWCFLFKRADMVMNYIVDVITYIIVYYCYLVSSFVLWIIFCSGEWVSTGRIAGWGPSYLDVARFTWVDFHGMGFL